MPICSWQVDASCGRIAACRGEQHVINPNKIEEMARSIQAALPPGLKSVGEEVDKKVKQVLQAQLMKLDLVSREEFDVQTKVLLRTREKLQSLEEKLQQLEKQLAERD